MGGQVSAAHFCLYAPLSSLFVNLSMAEPTNTLRSKLHEIIFEADTPAGKAFDVVLLLAILFSVLVVILESVASLKAQYGSLFYIAEWGFTILFTLEYVLRLYSINKPLKYAYSFFGVVDLLSILPTFLSLVLPGSQYLLTIRAFRLLRVFRVFKLTRFLDESGTIMQAMLASRVKITVFITFVLIVVVIMGTIMHMIEGVNNPGFSNIPHSIYWAIVTLTTVGYGDIAPVTDVGRFISAILMILGYAIIAVPTGIVTAEFAKAGNTNKPISTQACPNCGKEGHEYDATYCKFCGSEL